MIIFVYKALLAIALDDDRKMRSQVDWDFPVTVWGVVMMSRTRHRNWLGWLKKSGCDCKSVVKSALKRVGIWDLRDRQIGELSE